MSKGTMTSTATSTGPDQRTDARLDLARVIEALPDAVATAMQAVLPDQYTPELAAQIADDAAHRMRQVQAHPTAAQRGAEWMARWGCPPWCISEHGERFGMDWHSSALAETTMRDIDSASSETENGRIPFLAARIVLSSDKPQAYGRETRVWLDYGSTTGELTPAKAREVLTSMRGFVAELEAVVDQAEEIGKGDFDGDPEIARLDREAEDRRIARRTAELEAKADAALAEARA
ncbi:DUF6907 domain-containing protein [Streptomyces parvulus]|uniref:DUF6907 domain-containing protein n=1 Tax=Streptomyces parvulus TaxID=146923 RepID=UPI003406D422